MLNAKGDPKAALATYQDALGVATTQEDKALLHANCGYALAIFLDDRRGARPHIEAALTIDTNTPTPAGRALLKALPVRTDSEAVDWPLVFQGIGDAVQSGDPELWDNYLDDLQRLLWFIISRGAGPDFQKWMETADYPQSQAPLYHAFVAAVGDEDHLLKINPETRAPAERILAGLTRLLKLYGRGKAPRRT